MTAIKAGQPGSQLTESDNEFPVVGIGASAGGLDAFKRLITGIPVKSGMAYVLVQHLDPRHKSLLPDLLQKGTSIPVIEITDDIKVKPDHIYIIPSNKMLLSNDGILELSPRPDKDHQNLPIDLFFSSLAEVHKSHAIGVVLSGSASDGTLGLKAIKDKGGYTFAQDETTAVYKGMPHNAVQAGVVDFILAPEKIPLKILELIENISLNGNDEQRVPEQDNDSFKQILHLLFIRKGIDFTHYKQTTIQRRILRRMALVKRRGTIAYLEYLKENKKEEDLLYFDLLIPVTRFFRDTKTFNNLRDIVFPLILTKKAGTGDIRIWVAGCSTGQEAYSIAICLKDLLSSHKSRPNDSSGPGQSLSDQKVQIFATDISEQAIARSRAGIYKKSEVEGLTPELLEEYFTKENGHYRVKQSIREMCVFVTHNILRDPPFSKMDFVSCRNVLIYFESYLQKKALTTFHYALNPKGYLLLGQSESVSSVPELYEFTGKKDKLFTSKDVPGRFMYTSKHPGEKSFANMNALNTGENPTTDIQKTADDVILREYTPPGVVVNDKMEIVHFRGNAASYLDPLFGKTGLVVLKKSQHVLALAVSNIVEMAKKDNSSFRRNNIEIMADGKYRKISIEVIPLRNIVEPYYLVLFHDEALALGTKRKSLNLKIPAKIISENNHRIVQLEQELAQSREDMRSITEEEECANEELQSSNEELLSGNEELQSLNEELITSKEELQSTNEELNVVNQQMIVLNEQVIEARDYAESIIATIRKPLLVLDENLRVRSANNAFYEMFLVNEEETNGFFIYDLVNKQWNIPALRILLEEMLHHRTEFTDFEVVNVFPGTGEKVMLLNARKIKRQSANENLILFAIEDITERKQHQIKETQLLSRFQNLVMQAPVAICILKGKDYTVELANVTYLRLVDKNKDFINKPLFQSLPELRSQGVKELLDNVLESGTPFYGNELEFSIFRNGEKEQCFFNFVYQPMLDQGKIVTGIIVVASEVTEHIIAKNKNRENQEILTKELEDKVRERTMELREANEELQQKNQEIAVSKYNKRFLTTFSEKFSDYTQQNEFFNSLVQFLSDTTKMDYVLVGKLEENDKEEFTIQTIAITTFGKLSANIQYDLNDGPCERVIRGSVYSYPADCKQIFPKNKIIKQFNIEGYLGYPLFNSQRDPVGLIAVMHGTEIKNIEIVHSVLKIVAKRAEIELERIEQREQLTQNNKRLEENNEELLRMNKELQAFTYVSSHDLQEPLRKIKTFASLLLQKENQSLSRDGKNYLTRMENAASRMQTLIEDLLAYSRININERKFENTDLKIIVDEAKNDFIELIQKKNATISVNSIGEVSINIFQFHQLIQNLIGNALKFSRPGIPPYIRIASENGKGVQFKNEKLSPAKNYCHISIADNGIGFDPKYRDRIFEVFQRLHSKKEYAGTGIGLAIVKKIVENHNGIIIANGELGKGATFDIYIPAILN